MNQFKDEPPKEAANEGAEDEEAVTESFARNVPKGEQVPSEDGAVPVWRQRGDPLNEFKSRASEEFISFPTSTDPVNQVLGHAVV